MGLPFPEGLSAKCTDDRKRAMLKFAQQLFEIVGNVGGLPYPEGTEPKVTDQEQRLMVKINAMQNALP